jgi:hypothetical protein
VQQAARVASDADVAVGEQNRLPAGRRSKTDRQSASPPRAVVGVTARGAMSTPRVKTPRLRSSPHSWPGRRAGARTARQLGRTTHGATHLLLRRARYAGGYGGAGTSHALRRALLILLLGRLAHALLLVLRSRARGRRQFGAQVLVLPQQAGQFGFDLVEEGIDLVLVIAFSEADGRELLVPHVLGGQRHLFTST